VKLWVAFESTSRSLTIQIISVRPHCSLFFRWWNWRLPCCDIWPICACRHDSHDSTVLFQKNGAVTLLIFNDCPWISHNFPIWWHFLASPFARSVGLWFLFQTLPDVLHYLKHRSYEDNTILPPVFIHVLGSERSLWIHKSCWTTSDRCYFIFREQFCYNVPNIANTYFFSSCCFDSVLVIYGQIACLYLDQCVP
jgi:hypothetical protein